MFSALRQSTRNIGECRAKTIEYERHRAHSRVVAIWKIFENEFGFLFHVRTADDDELTKKCRLTRVHKCKRFDMRGQQRHQHFLPRIYWILFEDFMLSHCLRVIICDTAHSTRIRFRCYCSTFVDLRSFFGRPFRYRYAGLRVANSMRRVRTIGPRIERDERWRKKNK